MYKAVFMFLNKRMFEKTLDQIVTDEATEIKGAVNTKASQVSVDTKASQDSVNGIDVKIQNTNNTIGVTSDTGGTTSAGTIFGKLNKMLTDWTTTRAERLDANITSRQPSWGATTIHKDRIDTNIGSRASQESVDAVKIGVDNISAKVSTGFAVKKVQRGTAVPSGRQIAINIQNIDPTKSVVNLMGHWSLWDSSSGDTTWNPYVISLTATQLTIGQKYMDGNPNFLISWEVIEFN